MITASMVNAVAYCERLLYLRSKNSEDAENYYLVDGKAIHKRVDENARSLYLSSDRLGISAKMDVVEVNGNMVDLVEYKRGEIPDVPGGTYPPERVQLCVQWLILRDAGYRINSASIYFSGSKKRVQIEITDDIIAETLTAIARAREVFASDKIPPPLVDSSKCSGCSMVGICLPDEINLLHEHNKSLPQIRVGRDEAAPLYVQEHGARVGLRGEQLVVKTPEGETTVRLVHTSDVNLYGGAQISSQALRELMYREIPVSFFTTGGWHVGRAVGNENKNVDLRRRQYRAFENEETCLHLSRTIVASKIKNCKTLLRRNADGLDVEVLRGLDQAVSAATNISTITSLLGIEGAAARLYFANFSRMLRGAQDFDFEKRNRRPPRDPVNALLSFAYSLLVNSLILAITKSGLESLFGFYHEPRAGRPALALDLMEEFRPLIADSTVVSVINTGVVSKDDFVTIADACSLTSRGRKKFIASYERRVDQEIEHPVFGYRCSYRRVFEIQARLLGKFLLGEVDDYPAFNTR